MQYGEGYLKMEVFERCDQRVMDFTYFIKAVSYGEVLSMAREKVSVFCMVLDISKVQYLCLIGTMVCYGEVL